MAGASLLAGIGMIAAPSLAAAATGPALGHHSARQAASDAPSTVQVTNTNASGAGSLANALDTVASGGVITFASNVTGTIDIGTGDLQADGPVTIDGPGAAKLKISGSGTNGVPELITEGATTVSGLTISGKYETAIESGPAGGALTLDHVVIDSEDGVLAVPGANAALTIIDSDVTGAFYGVRVTVAPGGNFTLDHSTVSGANGYGVFGSATALQVYNCTNGYGYSCSYIAYGPKCPDGSNPQNGRCYATYADDATAGTVDIDNSTIADNEYGLYLGHAASAGQITRSTIVSSGTGISGTSLGGGPKISGDLFADNSAVDCAVNGGLTDDGYNLAEDGSCRFNQPTSTSSSALDAAVHALANNGGPAPTVALDYGTSDPAYKTIPASATLPGSTTAICSGTDERGFPRSAPCNVGAFDEPPPLIFPALSSKAKKTKYGWYDKPVTVTFTCISSSPLATVSCPKPITVVKQGRNQQVKGTARSADGQTRAATALVNIDTTKPSVKVTRGMKIACSDKLSGIASCKLSHHTQRGIIHYTATAIDKAGNKRTVTGTYRAS